ncbi:hypothetical protein SEEMU129_06380 [Salmonella enterica subsp. enterica serovar Muenchen str. RKS4129]|nr:hypothetical protein SEEMU129_06380 [Salmonella enterica subsp. enterica serovar Muenchen str. RKS4129]OJF36093.1 hypothetical protein AUR53_26530 [Escherichia coli]
MTGRLFNMKSLILSGVFFSLLSVILRRQLSNGHIVMPLGVLTSRILILKQGNMAQVMNYRQLKTFPSVIPA